MMRGSQGVNILYMLRPPLCMEGKRKVPFDIDDKVDNATPAEYFVVFVPRKSVALLI